MVDGGVPARQALDFGLHVPFVGCLSGRAAKEHCISYQQHIREGRHVGPHCCASALLVRLLPTPIMNFLGCIP